MGKMHKGLVGKSEGKRTIGRHKIDSLGNIKQTLLAT